MGQSLQYEWPKLGKIKGYTLLEDKKVVAVGTRNTLQTNSKSWEKIMESAIHT